jgi:hypothetical protein
MKIPGVIASLRAIACPPIKCRTRNPKRMGELAEAAFLLKAETLGFGLAKPWGDSERYDFILDSGSRLWRVQLKCTAALHWRGYEVQPIYSVYGKGKAVYTEDDIDALVVYILPRDIWYVLPVEDFTPCRSLRFFPDFECNRARWEKYRDAWHLLRTRDLKLET